MRKCIDCQLFKNGCGFSTVDEKLGLNGDFVACGQFVRKDSKNEWKYFIIVNDPSCYHYFVEDVEDDRGVLICNDVAVAKSFKSPDDLLKWVEENTDLSVENADFNIEGQYLPIDF